MATSVVYDAGADLANSKKRKNKTKRSCTFCRELHKMCDDERPCKRCVSHGRAHLCFTPAPKPKRSNRMFSLTNAPTGLSPALISGGSEAPATSGMLLQVSEEERVRNEIERQSKQQKIQQLQMQLQLAQRQLAQVQAQQHQQMQQNDPSTVGGGGSGARARATEAQLPMVSSQFRQAGTPISRSSPHTPATPISAGFTPTSQGFSSSSPSNPASPSAASLSNTFSLGAPPSPLPNPFDAPGSSFGNSSGVIGGGGASSGYDAMSMAPTISLSSSGNFVPLSLSGSSYVVPYVMSSPVTGLEDIGSPSLSDFDPDLMLQPFAPTSPDSLSDDSAANSVISAFYKQDESSAGRDQHMSGSSTPEQDNDMSPNAQQSLSRGMSDPDVIILDTNTQRNSSSSSPFAHLSPNGGDSSSSMSSQHQNNGATIVNGLDRNVDINQLVAAVDNLVLCPQQQQHQPQHQSSGQLVKKEGGGAIQMCHAKMSDMMWRLADKINASSFTPTLNSVFQRLLSVMLPKVALFDAKNTDFASLSVRFKVAIEMASELQLPAVLANARCVIYANEQMHQLTGGLLHARAKQAEVDRNKIYDFDLFHPDDAIEYFSYSLDIISDKTSTRSRKLRILSSDNPQGFVTCIVSQSILFEQMTTMPMFSLLTFTRID